jgi:transcription initiation factor TFIIE subunit alpha
VQTKRNGVDMGKKTQLTEVKAVAEYLKKVAGEHGLEIVRVWERSKKGFIDEDVAALLGVKVTIIRTALNRLHYWGISYYKKRKNRRTGWYTYKWHIDTKRLAELVLEGEMEALEKLKEKRLLKHDSTMFTCKKGCEEYPFEVAAEYQFRCPFCGDVMEFVDDTAYSKRLENQIKELERDVKKLKKILEKAQ